jgi:glycosyltransferase involved in cell wall biosynthesis
VSCRSLASARVTVHSVSAVFPCYNDAHTIDQMVLDVRKVLVDAGVDFEIIVANDGSRDESATVLDALAKDVHELRVIHHDVNRGYGGALLSGFGAATKEWIFYTDGDAQYDATELAGMLPMATDDVDIVQGWKTGRGDGPVRAVIGRTYHHVVKALFGLQVRDTDCDFRLFRRSLLVRRPLKRTSGVICVEMMYGFQHVGATFVETPVSHYPRPHGKSQFLRLPSIAKSAVQLGRLWIRLRVIEPFMSR